MLQADERIAGEAGKGPSGTLMSAEGLGLRMTRTTFFFGKTGGGAWEQLCACGPSGLTLNPFFLFSWAPVAILFGTGECFLS